MDRSPLRKHPEIMFNGGMATLKPRKYLEALKRSASALDLQVNLAKRRLATFSGAILLGLVAIGFAWAGDRAQHVFRSFQLRFEYAPLILTPLGFAFAAAVARRWAPAAKGSGIPQVMAAGRHPELAGALLSLPTALIKLVLTTLLLLVGASVGREGPTVQVSAAIMVAFHRFLRVPLTSGVLIAGGAAGVAAAFNTPLAGVAFAIEELAAAFEQRVAVLVMGAVVVAGLVSLALAGDYVYFGAMRQTLGLSGMLLVPPVAGIAGGAVGGLFSRTILAFARGRGRLATVARNKPVRAAFLSGVVVAILGVASGGLTWGTGYETTRLLIEGYGEAPLWFGPAKLAATAATAISGVPGGIFAPSLSVGAGFGELLARCFPSYPAGAIVLLGMVGYFVGVVRAPLTAVIILMEATASRGMIVPLFLTAIIADAVSKFVCHDKLYHGLAGLFDEKPPIAGPSK